ncbi:MAG: protein kinase [Ignavibacteriae bacterium]|nr:protein kinase [Ignavibacteria bacterium]MBI3364544.1 protein kinase [Ignavibacteriota bacterium]
MIGQTISHYKILEKLGEGGMGIVYKAEDTKLDRMVALKFLPSHLAASEQDKARFIQEAKAAAALNHPNVCSIIDIQEHDGQMFIVMEFVDGQTLREKKEAISFKQAIDIGIQIADGLAAAHEKGIVHRDIKPENIMVRRDGICQVMDFGLAKLRNASSKINRLTKEGSTVGTAGYMSPEQVQGQDTDHRSDIFSLGVLLYELFTGQLPFKGVHETALLYEIVNVDAPPMSAVKPEIDPSLDAIVLECLAKEPSERYQSVAEVGKELRRFKRESSRSRVSRVTSVRDVYKSSTGNVQTPSPQFSISEPLPEKKSRLIIWLSTTILFVLSTAALAFLYLRESSKEISPVRFTLSPPAKGVFEGYAPVISPSGQLLAFVARDSSGKSMIWIRPLAFLRSEPLPGTDNATYPFWSPDSRFLGFFQGGKLKKIEVNGGPAQTVADAPDGRGGSWSNSGIIIFAPSYGTGLVQVPESGGKLIELTTLDTSRREETHRFPNFLPDGQHFTYLSRSTEDEKTGAYLGSLDGKVHTLLLPNKSNVMFAAPGYLLFIRERSLMAQPFNADKGEFRGDAFPIAQDVGSNTRGNGFFSSSANGVLVFVGGGGASGERQFAWYDRTGKRLEKVGSPGNLGDMALSPDEKRVVFRRIDPQTSNQDLWILDLLRRTESRFTFRPATDDDPVWSPDGSKIVFDSNPDGVPNPFEKIATGAGTEQLLWKFSSSTIPYDWSSDGRYILLRQENRDTKSDLWALPLFGEKKPFPVLQTEASEDVGRFSPDGRWIAYESDESGKSEVYIQAFPASQGKWQVSVNGGGAPLWSKDGKEIFYLAPDKRLMVVDVKLLGTSIEQGIPKPLFDTFVDNYDAPNRYAVSRDGKRFLVNNSTDSDSSKPIMVVLNWTAEVTKK